jgi:hypothetical protein
MTQLATVNPSGISCFMRLKNLSILSKKVMHYEKILRTVSVKKVRTKTSTREFILRMTKFYHSMLQQCDRTTKHKYLKLTLFHTNLAGEFGFTAISATVCKGAEVFAKMSVTLSGRGAIFYPYTSTLLLVRVSQKTRNLVIRKTQQSQSDVFVVSIAINAFHISKENHAEIFLNHDVFYLIGV